MRKVRAIMPNNDWNDAKAHCLSPTQSQWSNDSMGLPSDFSVDGQREQSPYISSSENDLFLNMPDELTESRSGLSIQSDWSNKRGSGSGITIECEIQIPDPGSLS